jgi:hypothetical protein
MGYGFATGAGAWGARRIPAGPARHPLDLSPGESVPTVKEPKR